MEIEWLILADAIDVHNGKLYMLGGGWNRLTINKPMPVHQVMAIAMAIEVPWTETNERKAFTISINDGDGALLGQAKGQVEIGRPPGVPPGMPQRVQVPVNVDLELKTLGTYEIVASIEGSHDKHFPFFVVSAGNNAESGK